MTREQFKDLAMEIIVQQQSYLWGKAFPIFTSDNIDNFKVAQYDEDEYDVEAAMPFEEFLDDIYDAIMCEEDER